MPGASGVSGKTRGVSSAAARHPAYSGPARRPFAWPRCRGKTRRCRAPTCDDRSPSQPDRRRRPSRRSRARPPRLFRSPKNALRSWISPFSSVKVNCSPRSFRAADLSPVRIASASEVSAARTRVSSPPVRPRSGERRKQNHQHQHAEAKSLQDGSLVLSSGRRTAAGMHLSPRISALPLRRAGT